MLNKMSTLPGRNNKYYYNRVYLCYENTIIPTTFGKLWGFDCYRYNSFKNADDAWWKDRTELHKLNIRHTMIPICKWIPRILDKYILNWKLRNMYWKGEIKIQKGYDREN